MATARSPLPRRVAADTGALLALASTRDQYHAKARRTAEALAQAGTRLVGHTLVLGELHGHLLRHTSPAAARQLVSGLLRDPLFSWMEVTPELIAGAISNWLDRYEDQRFSLTDALSFEIMRQERITHAFAFDKDFTTAGFVLL
jgi:uncharacterized protein